MLRDPENKRNIPDVEVRTTRHFSGNISPCSSDSSDVSQKWACLWQPWLTLGRYIKSPFSKLRAMCRRRSEVRRSPKYQLQGDDGSDHGLTAMDPGGKDAGILSTKVQVLDLRCPTSRRSSKEEYVIDGSPNRSKQAECKAQDRSKKRRVRFAEPLPSLYGSGYVRDRRKFLRSQLRNYRKETKRGRHSDKVEMCILVRHP